MQEHFFLFHRLTKRLGPPLVKTASKKDGLPIEKENDLNILDNLEL
jgi:hypothetical protein